MKFIDKVVVFKKKIASWIEKNPSALLVALFFILSPEIAAAASGTDAFLCTIAQNFKAIVGTCALVAIVFWAIEHIFGVARIHDMVIKVGVACAVIAGAAALISASGLSSNCSF